MTVYSIELWSDTLGPHIAPIVILHFTFIPSAGTTRLRWSDSDCQYQCITVHPDPPFCRHPGAWSSSYHDHLHSSWRPASSTEILCKLSKTNVLCTRFYNVMPSNIPDINTDWSLGEMYLCAGFLAVPNSPETPTRSRDQAAVNIRLSLLLT